MEGREKEYKLSIRVTRSFYERFTGIAKRYGLTYNQLGNMSIQAGIGAIIRAVAPEEAFSPDQIAAIVQALKEKGVSVDIPEQANLEGVDYAKEKR